VKITTPEDLKDYFYDLAPSFSLRWESVDNYNIEDDGCFTFCGVCNEFAHYFIDQKKFKGERQRRIEPDWQETIEDSNLELLFCFIENVLAGEERQSDLASSIRSCFLEDISQTPSGEYAKRFMGAVSLELFSKWHV